MNHPAHIARELVLPCPDKVDVTYRRWAASEDQYLYDAPKPIDIQFAAMVLDRTVKAVRNRAWRLGLLESNSWTEKEIEFLKTAYRRVPLNSKDIAECLGRSVDGVELKANELGITNPRRPKKRPEDKVPRGPKFSDPDERRRYISECRRQCIAQNGHPRGALGMKHSDETKALIARKSKELAASRTNEERQASIAKMMRTKIANGTANPMRGGITWKAGWREIGAARKYYRSRWEANYARYLQWLMEKGEIASWSHEPKTFWFEGVRRGVVSYLPDFHVIDKNGSESYHEVKGWMDAKSKTKLKRMKKYHPKVKLVVIDGKAYESIARQMKNLIPGWEHGKRNKL